VIIITEQEKCTGETRDLPPIPDEENRPCDCETDELCHISNQGAPGDSNFNLILTPAAGHLHHSIPNGFCPGDLTAENCTCDGALAAAQSCGDPAGFGFGCKDNRN
jgi:hypothetical protein